MTDRSSSRLLVVLACGIGGGLIGAPNCCCFPFSAVAGVVAVRWLKNRDGVTLSVGEGGALGFSTGLVAGLVVASLGTLIFLANSDPDAIRQSQELVSGLTDGPAPELSMGQLASAYAFFSFLASTVLGALGGAVGSVAGGGDATSTEVPVAPSAGREGPPVPLPIPTFAGSRPPNWQDEPTMDGPIRSGFEHQGGLVEPTGMPMSSALSEAGEEELVYESSENLDRTDEDAETESQLPAVVVEEDDDTESE